MEAMEFQLQMKERQDEIERVLGKYLPENPSYQKTIFDAMEYSLMAGGKRIRPMMLKEAFILFGGTDFSVAEPFMAAIELIHTYSLVHDDLPAMDNDEYRRGQKTTHVVYGEDMGILTGDALLNYAFETAAHALCKETHLVQSARAIRVLSRKAGIYGMVGGQVVDVEYTGKALTPQMLEFIYELKTSALLEAALMVGAALAGATEEEIQVMEQVGRCVGMAFQIQDDILDITGTTQELGKPVGSDEKNEKNTYVALYGIEAAKQAVEDYSKQAIVLLQELEQKNEYLTTLVEYMISRKK